MSDKAGTGFNLDVFLGIFIPLCVVLLGGAIVWCFCKRRQTRFIEMIEMAVFNERDREETPSPSGQPPRLPPHRPPPPQLSFELYERDSDVESSATEVKVIDEPGDRETPSPSGVPPSKPPAPFDSNNQDLNTSRASSPPISEHVSTPINLNLDTSHTSSLPVSEHGSTPISSDLDRTHTSSLSIPEHASTPINPALNTSHASSMPHLEHASILINQDLNTSRSSSLPILNHMEAAVMDTSPPQYREVIPRRTLRSGKEF